MSLFSGFRAIAMLALLVGSTGACTSLPTASVTTATASRPTASSTQSASNLKPFQIVVLGDSIAAGHDGVNEIPDRWWRLAAAAVQTALPDQNVTVKNLALAGSGIVHLERTAAGVDVRDYQIAMIIEGRNDADLLDAEWSPRYVAVIEALESRGLKVILGTYPPTLRNGAFEPFPRNTAIRTVAGNKRPLLDFEARWLAAGPVTAGGWYTDIVHANAAGQRVEGDIATTVLLALAK